MKIAVVYWSGTGNTEAMANALVEGIKAAGVEPDVFSAPADFTPDKAEGYDVIAFGCPAMGAEVLEEEEFEPMFESVEGKISGKKIALFGSWGWGGGEWMDSWKSRCEDDDNAFLVADPVICQEAPDDETIAKLKELGAAMTK